MRKHTKIYLKELGYDLTDFVPSELSGARAVDIHHIATRENRVENLMALTRTEHIKHGEIKRDMCFLLRRHQSFLDSCGVKYSSKWFKEKIKLYSAYDN